MGKKTSRGRDFRKECWRYGVRLPFFFLFCLGGILCIDQCARGKKRKGGLDQLGFEKRMEENDSVMCAITMDYEYDVRCITCIDKKTVTKHISTIVCCFDFLRIRNAI